MNPTDPSRLVLLYGTGGYCIYHLDTMKIDDRSTYALSGAGTAEGGDPRLAKVMSKINGSLHGFCFDGASADKLFAFGQGVCMCVESDSP